MELINGSLVTEIGKAHGKTGAQVALKWLVQQGIPVIPKSDNPVHQRENMELFDFQLTSGEMARLTAATTPATAGGPNAQDSGDCSVDMDEAADVHPERKAMIEEIQSTPGVLWKAAPHPRFASEAPGASRALCGVKGDQKTAIKDMVQQGEIVETFVDERVDIPASFDSAENWPQCAKIIGDIRDQSNCGCCWAFAGAEAASDRMCISTNAATMIPLSAQDVCFNGGGFMSQGCNGGQITSPWSYMKKGGLFGGKGAVSGGQYQGSGPFGKGLCSDFGFPHCHHHGPQGDDPYPAEGQPGCPHQTSPPKYSECDADAQPPHNDFQADKYSYRGNTVTASGVSGIQQAIMAGGPMEVAFTVYSDFENYASGIYHHVSGEPVGGHAVKVVGWGVESGVSYWKIANSWNPYWGEKGYFRIKFGEGGIDDQAVASDPAAKWSRAGDATETFWPWGPRAKPAGEIAAGIVEGFLGVPDFKACIEKSVTEVKDVEEAIKLFETKKAPEVLKGIKLIGEAVKGLPDDIKACKAAVSDVQALIGAIKSMTSPATYAYHVGKDLLVNGRDIYNEIYRAVDDYKAKLWTDFGIQLGTAFRKLVIGTGVTDNEVDLVIV